MTPAPVVSTATPILTFAPVFTYFANASVLSPDLLVTAFMVASANCHSSRATCTGIVSRYRLQAVRAPRQWPGSVFRLQAPSH